MVKWRHAFSCAGLHLLRLTLKCRQKKFRWFTCTFVLVFASEYVYVRVSVCVRGFVSVRMCMSRHFSFLQKERIMHAKRGTSESTKVLCLLTTVPCIATLTPEKKIVQTSRNSCWSRFSRPIVRRKWLLAGLSLCLRVCVFVNMRVCGNVGRCICFCPCLCPCLWKVKLKMNFENKNVSNESLCPFLLASLCLYTCVRLCLFMRLYAI